MIRATRPFSKGAFHSHRGMPSSEEARSRCIGRQELYRPVSNISYMSIVIERLSTLSAADGVPRKEFPSFESSVSLQTTALHRDRHPEDHCLLIYYLLVTAVRCHFWTNLICRWRLILLVMPSCSTVYSSRSEFVVISLAG